MANELTPVEVLALSKCLKDKDVNAAKAAIADGSVHPFDFSISVQGTLTRAGGTAAMTSTVAASTPCVSLCTPAGITALLKQLGIGHKRLAEGLRAIGPKPEAVQDLVDVFMAIEADLATKLPPLPARETITPAKSGNISVTANVTRI